MSGKFAKKERITQTYNFLFSKQKHKSFNFWWRGAGGGVNFLLHKKIIHIHISVFYVFGHNIKSCSCFAVGAGEEKLPTVTGQLFTDTNKYCQRADTTPFSSTKLLNSELATRKSIPKGRPEYFLWFKEYSFLFK